MFRVLKGFLVGKNLKTNMTLENHLQMVSCPLPCWFSGEYFECSVFSLKMCEAFPPPAPYVSYIKVGYFQQQKNTERL